MQQPKSPQIQNEFGQVPEPRRTQFYLDYNTQKKYFVDTNNGRQISVDGSGVNTKTYHTNFTGVVSADRRRYKALALGDQAMAPEIHKQVKLNLEILPKMLDKANQQHLLPYRSPRQFLAHKTGKQTQMNVTQMASMQSKKYGITSFEGFKLPYKKTTKLLKNQFLDDKLRGSVVQKPLPERRSVSHMNAYSPNSGKKDYETSSIVVRSSVKVSPTNQQQQVSGTRKSPRNPPQTSLGFNEDKDEDKMSHTSSNQRLPKTSHVLVVPRDRHKGNMRCASVIASADVGGFGGFNDSALTSVSRDQSQTVTNNSKIGKMSQLASQTRKATMGLNSFDNSKMLTTALQQGFSVAGVVSPKKGSDGSRSPSLQNSYRGLKEGQYKASIVPKFAGVKKHDIRENTVNRYFERISSSCYDDWEARETLRKQKVSESQLAKDSKGQLKTQAPPAKAPAPSPPKKGGKNDPPTPPEPEEQVVETPKSMSVRSLLSEKSLDRPTDKTIRLAHGHANRFFEKETLKRMDRDYQNLLDDEDHDFPFQGSKHLNPIGANHEQVKMSLRLVHDFKKLDAFKDPSLPPPPTKHQYEKYLKHKASRQRTKGRFQADPERAMVVKHPAEHQLREFNDLMILNPSLKGHLARQLEVEDKKLHLVRQARMYSDQETKIQMAKTLRQAEKDQKVLLRTTWQREPSL